MRNWSPLMKPPLHQVLPKSFEYGLEYEVSVTAVLEGTFVELQF